MKNIIHYILITVSIINTGYSTEIYKSSDFKNIITQEDVCDNKKNIMSKCVFIANYSSCSPAFENVQNKKFSSAAIAFYDGPYTIPLNNNDKIYSDVLRQVIDHCITHGTVASSISSIYMIHDEQDKTVIIKNISTNPEFRGCGLGNRLLVDAKILAYSHFKCDKLLLNFSQDELLDYKFTDLKKLGVSIEQTIYEGIKAAKSLYTKHGFEKLDKHLESNGDSYNYQLNLKK